MLLYISLALGNGRMGRVRGRAALGSAVCSALGTVYDRHSPKLVLLNVGLLWCLGYVYSVYYAVCMQAAQWAVFACAVLWVDLGRSSH